MTDTAGQHLAGLEQDLTASELMARIESGAAPIILDVRSRLEFVRGRVPGALHIPFWTLLIGSPDIPAERDDPIVIYCGHGPRARLAGAALRSRGFQRLAYLQGHMAHWRKAGLPEDRG